MRGLTYIYEQPGWPALRWDRDTLTDLLASVRHKQGRLIGRMEGLGFSLRQHAVLQTLSADVLKSSDIEGEKLDAQLVRSSVARRLGIDIGGLKPVDRKTDGVVEMMLDATRNHSTPLTRERLFAWHASLFPAAEMGLKKIRVGAWREDSSGPMQVVSAPIGRARVHFQAPPAHLVNHEMLELMNWFNGAEAADWVANAGIAHLWFVTVHPFDDGNGRIARAITDMALARSENSPQRFYSMSAEIREERSDYYAVLERTQKGSLDVTGWMEWFFSCLDRAIDSAEVQLEAVLFKARVLESIAAYPLNERQRRMINRLLDGFEGKLTSVKWAKLTNTSHDTATRDIAKLIEYGVLVRDPAGGRSTSYSLAPLTRR